MIEKLIPLLLFSTYYFGTRAEIISSILNTIGHCIPNERFTNINFINNLLISEEMTNLVYENFHENEQKNWYKII